MSDTPSTPPQAAGDEAERPLGSGSAPVPPSARGSPPPSHRHSQQQQSSQHHHRRRSANHGGGQSRESQSQENQSRDGQSRENQSQDRQSRESHHRDGQPQESASRGRSAEWDEVVDANEVFVLDAPRKRRDDDEPATYAPPSDDDDGGAPAQTVLSDITQKPQGVKEVRFPGGVGTDQEHTFPTGRTDCTKIFPVL